MTALKVKSDLKKLGSVTRAKHSKRFFKAGPGEYGEGDLFIGVTVPNQRKVAKSYKDLSFSEIKKLLDSRIHEHRLTALIILVGQYQKGDKDQKQRVFNFYLDNLKGVNNWDLVDTSAHKIIGAHLLNNHLQRKILHNYARSDDLWLRRIAVISTFAFIDNEQYEDSLKIAETLLHDEEDLIHKAVGWMLRELGKKNQVKEENFLLKHHKDMPRTMLRYSIEKFSLAKRKRYMAR